MELQDTAVLMSSSNYKDRFIAEYWQTKIRYEKLKSFNDKIEAYALTVGNGNLLECPKHDCPEYVLREQQYFMGKYLHYLELRAIIEKVDLNAIIAVPNVKPCFCNAVEGED